MSLARLPRLLFPTLGAVLLALTFGVQPARAAGGSSAHSALQVSVQVVRPCAIDTAGAPGAGAFDAAGRAAFARATESRLATSCEASEVRVTISDVRVNLVEPSGTLPRLDVEF